MQICPFCFTSWCGVDELHLLSVMKILKPWKFVVFLGNCKEKEKLKNRKNAPGKNAHSYENVCLDFQHVVDVRHIRCTTSLSAHAYSVNLRSAISGHFPPNLT